MEVSGCGSGGVGVLLQLGFECGSAFVGGGSGVGGGLAGLLGGGVRGVEFGLELVGTVAVLGGFGGGDVDERPEIGGIGGGLFGVLLEFSPQGFELAGAVGCGGFGGGGAVAVLRGFGG